MRNRGKRFHEFKEAKQGATSGCRAGTQAADGCTSVPRTPPRRATSLAGHRSNCLSLRRQTADAVPGWSDGNLAHICADRLHGRSMSRIAERPSRIAVRSRIVHGQVRNTADRRHLVLHNDRRRSFALCQSTACAPPASTAIDSASRAESRLGATKRTPTSSARSLASRR